MDKMTLDTSAALNRPAFDASSLNDLKRVARNNSPEALKAAARQFEGVFLQMVMKSMREAVPQSGLLEGDESKMYQSLLDQQLTQNLAARGGTGLAQMIEKQLGRALQNPNGQDAAQTASLDTPAPAASSQKPLKLSMPQVSSEEPRWFPLDANGLAASARARAEASAPGQEGLQETPPTQVGARSLLDVHHAATATAQPDALATGSVAAVGQTSGAAGFNEADLGAAPREFVNQVWPHAVEASRQTGIPARFLVAQAALETGWGRSQTRTEDGRPSYNLFNIKATRGWEGGSVEVSTVEYINGQPRRENARFRTYGSYAEAFQDYANLIRGNPRYARVVGESDPIRFARGLQDAGYATDPMYAVKLARIINGSTLRQTLLA